MFTGLSQFPKVIYCIKFDLQQRTCFPDRGIHFWQFHQAAIFGWTRKSRSTFGFTEAWGYWWLGLMDFRNFFTPCVFEVKKSIFGSFTKLLCFGWPRKSRSTSGFTETRGYWWLGLTDVRNFSIPYIFEVKESIPRSFTKLNMFGWPRKSRSTSGFTETRGYWWLGVMDFRNFFTPYVFEVKEVISGSFTKLPCLSDLEQPGQLPVSPVLEGTDDWVLWIFAISSFPTFLRSRNPFLSVSQSYYVWVTSKIQVNFRFYRCSRVLMIGCYGFS